MAVRPPLPLTAFLLGGPILYYLYSNLAVSTIIIYAHSFCVAIWLCSIPEIRLLLQNILGFSSGKGLSLSGEMYGLQHTVYNLKPLPQTYWFNMGLWDGSNQTFADACRNLVHKVMSELGGHAQVDNSRLLGKWNEFKLFPGFVTDSTL